MTVTEFIKALKLKCVETKAVAKLDRFAQIRFASGSMCPIEFLASTPLCIGALHIGRRLGLSEEDIQKIMDASDNWQPDKIIRLRLLKACGLK